MLVVIQILLDLEAAIPSSFADPSAGNIILDSHIDQFISPINNIENGISYLAVGNSGTDDYTATVTPAPPTLNSGAKGYYIHFQADVNNVGPCTLALNGGSAKSIKTAAGADPGSDVLVAGGFYLFTWDGTYWQIASGSFDTATAATDAADISFDDTGLSITATDVQVAITEVLGAVEDHIADTVAAHAGTAISNTAAGTISSTTVQAAINELDGDISGHLSDTTDAHDASAISFVASGSIASVNVQAAIEELDTTVSLIAGGYIPDAPPASPNVADDEFDVGSAIDTAGTRFAGATAWAWNNQSTATGDLESEIFKLALPSSASVSLRRVEQPCSGSWKYRCKLSPARIVVLGPNYQYFGMCVANNSSGKIVTFGVYSGTNLQTYRWDNATTFNGNVSDQSFPNINHYKDPFYLEIENDGTTLTFRYSYSGYNFTFTQHSTETIATHLSSVDRIGLCAYTSNSNAMTVGYDWFRRIS